MNEIIPPINRQTTGSKVSDLQDALQACLDHAVIFADNERTRLKLSTIFREERATSLYGEVTVKLVSELQSKLQPDNRGLEVTGDVDDTTAKILNNFLRQWGLLNPKPATDDVIPPDIRTDTTSYKVYGMVRDEYGQILDKVTVQLFNRTMRNEQLLKSSIVVNGYYEIYYQFTPPPGGDKQPDLVIKILDTTEKELYKSAIWYNVPNEVEINIFLKDAKYKGPSEFEVINTTLTPLTVGVKPVDLREDDQFQDISFLAGESGLNFLVIVTWVACYYLSDACESAELPLEPAVFFAFMRQGRPSLMSDSIRENIKDQERFSLLCEKLLRDLVNISLEQQKSMLERALENNLIPAYIKSKEDKIFEILRQLKIFVSANVSYGPGKSTIDQLLALNPAMKEKATVFITKFIDHTGPIDQFWKNLQTDKTFDPESIRQTKLIFDLNLLARGHIPLVAQLKDQFNKGTIKYKRDLAKYSVDDWVSLLKTKVSNGNIIGTPENIDGENDEEKIKHFATILERQFEQAYPTTSFSAKLGRIQQSSISGKDDVIRFIQNNPKFYLDRHRLDSYIRENKDALKDIPNPNQLLKNIKSVQRIFKLNPTYKMVDRLTNLKINSAQQIYFMGKEQFLAAVGTDNINKIEGMKTYYRAENTYAYALSLLSVHNRMLKGLTPASIPNLSTIFDQQDTTSILPNLTSLFGSLDYCECIDCRSVYSPAAYFVDIMHFLGARKTQGVKINAGKSVKDVLLRRRPDLGEIKLSCANTNTPLPYVDLVNELLEDMVASPISLNKQTTLSAAELRANPEYTNPNAYDFLKKEVFPFNLPFDLWSLESFTYLEHIGVPRSRLLELFQQKIKPSTASPTVVLQPSDVQIDCSWLNIIETERQILTGVSPKESYDFWGLPATKTDIPNPDTPDDPTKNIKEDDWVAALSHVSIMLNRSGLTYQELLQLLDMKYVNPNKKILIQDITPESSNVSCDLNNFRILNLAAESEKDAAANRMHQFIRLWRKLGCKMWELDLLLSSMFNNKITDAILQSISRMKRLQVKLNLDWRALCSFYAKIDNDVYFDYGQDGTPAIQTLYQQLFCNKLVDASLSFPEDPYMIGGPIQGRVPENDPVKDKDKIPCILAALNIKEMELDLIISDLNLKREDNLDLIVLSHMYRIVTLSKAINLTIDDFISLKRLFGKEPFADPANTLDFIALAERISNSTFSIAELDYLLTSNYKLNSGMGIDDKTITSLVESIRGGVQKIIDAVKNLPNDTGLLKAQKENFIFQKIAEVLHLETPTVEKLLTNLQLSGSSTTLLQVFDDAKLVQKQADNTYQFAIIESNFGEIFKALRLLHKNALMISKLNIKNDEVIWWLQGTHAIDMAWLHPKDFPLEKTATAISIRGWEYINDFFKWKNQFTSDSITAFELMDKVLDIQVSVSDVILSCSQLTSWNSEDITKLLQAFQLDAKQALKDQFILNRLTDCMLALQRLGVSASRAIAWAKYEPTNVDAEDLKQAVKAKYSLDQWRQAIQPLQDTFREQKRKSLTSWLVMHSNQEKGWSWSDTNGLYSYLLIDVEMCSCMLTSRLKQATASVQLFVQRCLMNLEFDVYANVDLDSKWNQWKWMQYYRLWEANRQIFLYPENWLEPQLRRDKSQFFKDLENELMQNEINNDTVEQAYLNYLEKLDKVANLEIRAMYNEVGGLKDENGSVLHVFGRTRSSHSPEYYYRQRLKNMIWTPWQKIDLDITSDHLMAGIYNRRLHLFWPQFLEKADKPTTASIPSQGGGNASIDNPNKYWEIRLFESEFKNNKWSPKVLSYDCEVVYQSQFGVRRYTLQPNTWDDNLAKISFRINLPSVDQLSIETRIFSSDDNDMAPVSAIGFHKVGKQVNSFVFSLDDIHVNAQHITTAPESKYAYNLIQHTGKPLYFFFSAIDENVTYSTDIGKVTKNQNAEDIQLLGNIEPYFTYTVIDSKAKAFENQGSFFIWDKNRSYIVDYSWNKYLAYGSRTGSWHTNSSFNFMINYHPFVEVFIRELNTLGIKGLLNRQIQIDPANIPDRPHLHFLILMIINRLIKLQKIINLKMKMIYYPIRWRRSTFHV